MISQFRLAQQFTVWNFPTISSLLQNTVHATLFFCLNLQFGPYYSLAISHRTATATLNQPNQTALVLCSNRTLNFKALCMHMMYSMYMHSCLNTYLKLWEVAKRENMTLSCLVHTCGSGGHRCMYVAAPVYVSDRCAQFLCAIKLLWSCVFLHAVVCTWTVCQACRTGLLT